MAYIRQITQAAYGLTTDEIFPQNDFEKKQFAETKKEWMDLLFKIQLELRKKMLTYHAEQKLSEQEVSAFRTANLYLSYAQDFVLQEWASTQDLRQGTKLFEGEFPITQRNSEIKGYSLQPGDVILVRGGSFISATIARAGDFASNFSHIAVVVQDPSGQIYVAESLLETGLKIYSVDEYLGLEKLSRALVMRHRNPVIAKAAALAGFKIYNDDINSKNRLLFDLSMDPENHDKVYCAEYAKMMYAAAEKDMVIPEFPMSFRKALAESAFFRTMGNHLEKGFSPDDIFFQPEFDVVMNHRDISLLKKSWAWDVASSTVFEYAANRFDYKYDIKSAGLANLGYFAKKMGFQMNRVPSGVGPDVIRTILEHQSIMEAVQAELQKYMDATPRPLAYQELRAKAYSFLQTNSERYFVPLQGARRGAPSCRVLFGP